MLNSTQDSGHEFTDPASFEADPAAGGLDQGAGRADDTELRRLRAEADRAPRLLQAVRIGNVKSLADEHIIPLAPLTLIYGPNAAGKSTIIQSLQLLAQSVQAGEFTPAGPRVDVHDFRHVVTGHDPDKSITIGIDFGIEVGTREVPNPEADYFDDLSDLGGGLIRHPGRVSFPVMVSSGMLHSYSYNEGNPRTLKSLWLNEGPGVSQPDTPVQFEDEGDLPLSDPFVLCWRMDLSDPDQIDRLLSAIDAWKDTARLSGFPDEDNHLLAFQKWAENDVKLLRFAKSQLEAGTANWVTLDLWLADPWEVDPGRRAPSRLYLAIKPTGNTDRDDPVHYRSDRVHDRDLLLEGWANGDKRPGSFEMKAIPQIFQKVEKEARRLLTFSIITLGPIRPAPGQDYLAADTSVSASFALVKRLYDDQHLLRGVNEWFATHEIPYSIGVDRLVREKSADQVGYSLGITDKRVPVEVGLADVGYGVSQVLPIVAECLGAKGRIICIEQPELHLHPRLQAELADLFAGSANGHGRKEHGNQIIAETHSKSILLRVRKLIRTGELVPDDVAVLYVDNDQDKGVSVQRLRLGTRGQLLDPWPTGFFDDSLRDVLGISNATEATK